MFKLDPNYIYVKVYKDKLELHYLNKEITKTINAISPFSTERLLIGQFEEAVAYLKEGIQGLLTTKLFSTRPIVIIHPMEMIQNRLSQVEECVLKELPLAAGARKSFVWVGHELSYDELRDKIQTEFK